MARDLEALTKGLSDKYHEINWATVYQLMIDIAWQAQTHRQFYPIASIHGIPRGGLPLACFLSSNLGVRLVDEHDITINTLIVDEIADSGKTLATLMKRLKVSQPGIWGSWHLLKTAVLIKKDSSLFQPDFVAATCDERWVIFPWETGDDLPKDFFRCIHGCLPPEIVHRDCPVHCSQNL